MQRRDFIRWTEKPPPFDVPLQIYCGVKDYIYHQAYTRQELEAWCKQDQDIEPVNWSRVGWRLTGIAKEMIQA